MVWREIKQDDFCGVWIAADDTVRPDIVIYYCHGGGFSMGSSFFYIEFLMAWVTLLQEAGYVNPAILALEYTLVPDATYPRQIHQTLAGYEYVLSVARDPSRVVVAGDSAGATLILSTLLHMSEEVGSKSRKPGLGVLISPWVTIISEQNRNTASDYLNADSLHLYGSQYLGKKTSESDPVASPGECKDAERWRKASPSQGWLVQFGSEEVLGPETRDLIGLLQKSAISVEVDEAQGGIHAWPVATLYLGESRDARLKGLRDNVSFIKRKLKPSNVKKP